MKNIILGISLLIFAIVSCKHEAPEVITSTKPADTTGNSTPKNPCDSNVVYFGRDILPILNSNCAMSGCHDAGTAAEGVVLTSYDRVMQTAKVVPFSTNNSELYEVITETRPDKVMPPPPKSKLTPAQISLIAKWINQGAKNLTCDEQNCDTVNISYTNMISKTMNTYCVGCHGANNPSAGISVHSYASLATIAGNGKLVGSITHAAGYKAMPQGGKLPACEIKQIQKWVEMGYPNN